MTDWHVWQKVVCVDAHKPKVNIIVSGSLRERAVYTVRSVFMHEGVVALRLEEIRCVPWRTISPHGDDQECAFEAARFRPIVIPEADIAQFEAILRGVEKREPVEA